MRREKNLGCLRRAWKAPWWKAMFMPTRCRWRRVWRGGRYRANEEVCENCGSHRHYLPEDVREDRILWRAGKAADEVQVPEERPRRALFSNRDFGDDLTIAE